MAPIPPTPPSSTPAGPSSTQAEPGDRTPPISVEHRVGESRFVAQVDGHLNVADYHRDAQGRLWMTHTGVHPSLQGRGIAAALVHAAVAHARAEGLRIVPQCSYVAAWMARHPEHADLLAAPGCP